jgi:hypothetical protein
MAGRPKRDDEVEVVFLRLPKEMLARIVRSKGLIELEEGVNLNKTQAFLRLLDAGCAAIERTHQSRATPGPAPAPPAELSERASEPLSELVQLSNIATGLTAPDTRPVSLKEEDAAERPAPAVPRRVPHPATRHPRPRSLRPAHQGQRGLSRAKLQEIADEYTLCEGLSYSEFAQRLHDKGIYSATAKDGSKGPANRGNVKKWLDQARDDDLL